MNEQEQAQVKMQEILAANASKGALLEKIVFAGILDMFVNPVRDNALSYVATPNPPVVEINKGFVPNVSVEMISSLS